MAVLAVTLGPLIAKSRRWVPVTLPLRSKSGSKFVLAHREDQDKKRSRFSEAEIIGIHKEHEAVVSVADLCRKHGVSDASIYNWGPLRRNGRFGGAPTEGAGGREHAAKTSAGRHHARQHGIKGSRGKDMVTPAAMRKAVARLKGAFGMSERRACRAVVPVGSSAHGLFCSRHHADLRRKFHLSRKSSSSEPTRPMLDVERRSKIPPIPAGAAPKEKFCHKF